MPDNIVIERLSSYTEQDARDLGQLLANLSSHYDGEPIAQTWLDKIIASPYHDLVVARQDGKIIGTASLSTILHPIQNEIGYLEAFVVDPTTQGQGVGNLIWQEIDAWCREKNVRLQFTSRPSREVAHRFYLKHGAMTRDTTFFTYSPTDD